MTDGQGLAPSPPPRTWGSQSSVKKREAPKAIQLLLPVWGKPFISQFLQMSLPTLLAPGNLPSIAKSLPCRFIFLTSSEDTFDLRNQPLIHHLRELCEVEFTNIDDLITGDNYSTTVTLAYARAVRAAGAAMLDTCFFFMISDYIMADGSLANVLAKIQAGYSGVVAGNFQVVEEDASESFFRRFDRGDTQIAIHPRTLIRWATDYLHPMTLANMVNFPLCHSIHSNRLFWRVDKDTLIGRFYLMHMICIRPEVADFFVGSSCDYSFIPEMCPSGNVYVLTDSDDYLVIEMQRRSHELNFLRLGASKPDTLIKSLAEWTTAVHRKNAHAVLIYHASDLPPNLDSVVTESKAYIDAIERSLPPPQPHRNHPYWLGAIAAHRWAVLQQKGIDPVSELPEINLVGFNWWLFRCRNFVYGRPPKVRPWHPRWPDYRMFRKFVQRHFSGTAGSLLIISGAPAIFSNLLDDVSPSVVSLDLHRFLHMGRHEISSAFGGCLLVLRENEIGRAYDLIKRIKPLLSRNHALLIFAINGYGADLGAWFGKEMLRDVAQFFHNDLPINEVVYVPAGWISWIALRGLQRAFVLIQRHWIWMSLEIFVVSILTFISFVSNLLRFSSKAAPSNQVCSSLALVMHSTMGSSVKVPRRTASAAESFESEYGSDGRTTLNHLNDAKAR
jgi:hypothetical protein